MPVARETGLSWSGIAASDPRSELQVAWSDRRRLEGGPDVPSAGASPADPHCFAIPHARALVASAPEVAVDTRGAHGVGIDDIPR
jgi:hypothetical protein